MTCPDYPDIEIYTVYPNNFYPLFPAISKVFRSQSYSFTNMTFTLLHSSSKLCISGNRQNDLN